MTQPEALRRYKLTRRWRELGGDCYQTGICVGAAVRAGGQVYRWHAEDKWVAAAWHRRGHGLRRTYASLPAALRAVERWLERAKEKK